MKIKKLNNEVATGQIQQDGLCEEAEKASCTTTGVLTIKSANDWIEEAAKRPDPKSYFHELIVEQENTVLFASSNVGKSIMAVQIAEDIASTQRVYYVDLELSDKQFQKRYTDLETGAIHVFPPNFMRAELDPELIGGASLATDVLDSIAVAAENGVKFVIVDNLTFICPNAEKSDVASEFMMKLLRLKKKYGLTTIVVAHTPKRRGYKPITHDDLAGSSKLMGLFDAGIAMARSARDQNLRYMKQVKVRTGEYKYDDDNVMVLDLVKENGYLHFEIRGCEKEYDHLKHGDPSEDIEEILDVLRLRKAGKSLRAIAKELGISLGKVQRRLDKAEEKNITLPEDEGKDGASPVHSEQSKPPALSVSPVSIIPLPIRSIRDTEGNSLV